MTTATLARPTSAFAKFERKAWQHRFHGVIEIATIAGGVPSDPKVAEGWIKTKLGTTDDILREQVAEVMVERGVDAEEATRIASEMKHLNGFKRDADGLYIEGRQLKSALKEAAGIAVAAGKVDGRGWGKTNKSLRSFFAEVVMVEPDRLHLGVTEATGVAQRFIHKMTMKGPVSAIQYEEYVENARIEFDVLSSWDFTDEQWAMFWLIGEQEGIGASRSQGFGRYTVTEWTAVK
jgi:hypothetical protein